MQRIGQFKKNGFTLLELLVALVIVAIGALGHAKMQISSMRNAQRASFSQTANLAMNDLTQRIRALPNAALNGQFNIVIGTGPTGSESCNDRDDSNSCTRAEFASFELEDWFGEVSAILPAPQFSIVQDSSAASGSLFTLTLIWDANRDGKYDNTNCDEISKSITDQCEVVNLWIR